MYQVRSVTYVFGLDSTGLAEREGLPRSLDKSNKIRYLLYAR
jgi:hypothetical protein